MRWIVSFLIACFSFCTSASTLPTTDVRFYRPFEQQVEGQITPQPAEKLRGTCFQHSTLDHRTDAWQCQAGNRILDPCFIKTYVKTKQAICPLSPWEKKAVIIDFTEQADPPINNSNKQDSLDMSTDDPWAIDLADGIHCLRITDAEFIVHGQRIKYACDNHGFLLGRIQRCELIWKMLFLPSRDSDTLNMIEIMKAWY